MGFGTRHQPNIHLIPKAVPTVIVNTRRQRGVTGREATGATGTPGQTGEPGQSPKPNAHADQGIRGHRHLSNETMKARTRTESGKPPPFQRTVETTTCNNSPQPQPRAQELHRILLYLLYLKEGARILVTPQPQTWAQVHPSTCHLSSKLVVQDQSAPQPPTWAQALAQ